MEGSLSPVACLDEPSGSCDRASDCVTLEVWIKLKDAIDSVVDNITLQDLVDRHFEKGTCEYYI
jgi:DNA-binding IscR family transcriptional regulator